MPTRLKAVADACRAKGAAVDAALIDVVDRAALAAWLTRFDDAHPVDLLIANAGISIDNGPLLARRFRRRAPDAWRSTSTACFNTVEPLVGRMMARKRGQIAVVASLAGFIGLPYSASYNASKAAVRVWGESIRYVLKKNGIGVSVICPGFVGESHHRQRPFKMPFLMNAATRLGDHPPRPRRATRRASPSRSRPRPRSGSAGSCPAAGRRGCWARKSCRTAGVPPAHDHERAGRPRSGKSYFT